jgi:hypothetical protein
MAYPPISTLPTPPSRQDPANFATEADAFLGALPTFQSQVNAAGTYIDGIGAAVDVDAAAAAASALTAQAAATTAVNAANAQVWVSGTTYAAGAVVYSPITYQTYRCILATSGTVDPSINTTNWVQLGGSGGLTEQTATLTTTAQTAIATYDIADFLAMELTVVASRSPNRTITKLLIVHNGTTASATQYGEVNTNSALATYDVDISGGNVRLLATSSSATSTDFTVKENLFAPL